MITTDLFRAKLTEKQPLFWYMFIASYRIGGYRPLPSNVYLAQIWTSGPIPAVPQLSQPQLSLFHQVCFPELAISRCFKIAFCDDLFCLLYRLSGVWQPKQHFPVKCWLFRIWLYFFIFYLIFPSYRWFNQKLFQMHASEAKYRKPLIQETSAVLVSSSIN